MRAFNPLNLALIILVALSLSACETTQVTQGAQSGQHNLDEAAQAQNLKASSNLAISIKFYVKIVSYKSPQAGFCVLGSESPNTILAQKVLYCRKDVTSYLTRFSRGMTAANREILSGKVQLYCRNNKTWHCSASINGV